MKILLSSNNKDFTHNTKYMFEYLLENTDYEIKYVLNDKEKKERLNKKYENNYFISITDKEGKEYLENSNVWLLDAGMPTKNPFYMRNKIIINYWHGVPIKQIGINGYKGLNWLRMFLQLKLFSNFITAYITTSKNMIDIMAQSFILPKEKIKVLGQPRNNYLNKTISKKEITKFYNDINKDSKFILYAPTWRKSKYGGSFDSEVKYFPFDDFDMEELENYLEKEKITIFLRPHPLEKITIKESKYIKIFDNDKTENINEYLNIFDLLIADYSGIYIDYLLLDKPILLLPYDKEEYISIKGFNFDYNDISPAPKPNSLKDFKIELLKLLSDDDYFKDERAKVNDFFNEIKKDSLRLNLEFLKDKISERFSNE
jgi:CDP-glycerol glycerophosphotransferase